MVRLSLLCAALLACMPAVAQTSLATNAPAGQPLSMRVVAYTINAKIDAQKKTVDATETLTYRNLTGQPLNTFPFHLYLNAFQPDSTFTTETHFHGGIRDQEADDEYPDRKRGSITVSHLEADGFGDLTSQLHFIAPDDGNPHDRTVALLTLPRAVAPGENITFQMTFHDVFPESVARNGYKRDFLMGGQWFPKVGVYWKGQWNCHQYHSTTEFFSDFGTYNVTLTLPRNYTVGASGVPTSDHTNADGTKTLSFYGEDIHDFAWAASPHFNVSTDTYLSSMGPVQVRVLTLAAHPQAAKRYMDTLMGSLRQFDARYGPYPYKMLTLIDPEPGSEMGGMEYPTLITGDAEWLEPRTLTTEITTEHEFGHQYWYGMVATNEFEEAWLDEGINSYTETEVTNALYGRYTSFLGLPWINLSDSAAHYLEYLGARDYDPVTRRAWLFHDGDSYGGVTYGKSSLLLRTLAGLIGQDVMDEAMRTYFMRFRFTHPTTEDFLAVIKEVAFRHDRNYPRFGNPEDVGGIEMDQSVMLRPLSQQHTLLGSELTPFLNQAVYGTQVLDYAVEGIHSDRERWWLSDKEAGQYVDSVTLHRIGDFVLPAEVEIVFADGSRVHEIWAPEQGGNDRWKTFTYRRGVKITSAEIDPDHLVPLDVDQFNNSFVEKPNRVPAGKLTTLLVAAEQLGSQLAGWLI